MTFASFPTPSRTLLARWQARRIPLIADWSFTSGISNGIAVGIPVEEYEGLRMWGGTGRFCSETLPGLTISYLLILSGQQSA